MATVAEPADDRPGGGRSRLLEGETAIVTGATSGIGTAVATRMAEEGAAVVLAGRDPQRGKDLEGQLRASGRRAWFVPVELTDVASIRRLVEKAVELAGPISILVNNAGVTKKIGILEITEQQWDWMDGINSRGLFFCLQAVAAHMRERGRGKIVNVSSIGGKAARGTSNAAYAASKAAAIAIARVAAAELGPYNINVNSVCPGPTRTGMLRNNEHAQSSAADAPLPSDVMDAIRNNSVLRRFNEPEDVANAIVFLSSRLADNITGQSINVDSGTIWD